VATLKEHLDKAVDPDWWHLCYSTAREQGCAETRSIEMADECDRDRYKKNGAVRYAAKDEPRDDPGKWTKEKHSRMKELQDMDDATEEHDTELSGLHGEFMEHRKGKRGDAKPKKEPEDFEESEEEDNPEPKPSKPKGSGKGPWHHPPSRTKAASDRLQSLHDRATDPDLSYEEIEDTVSGIAKEFDADGLKAVAQEFGMKSGLSSKGTIVRRIVDRISHRKGHAERGEEIGKIAKEGRKKAEDDDAKS